ncbi:uncharacterized protein LOC111710591 [Eurytemora carolleeae]|uniref:uncharacterized protein LOC111710591 n=1 Tax=Eurytemora carolleeae TaxID=1294199 RepID=UPI000C78B4B7|nr:uncharacterized protein LOC111710591 [Eurytemora carolleeae]XP_023340471.1 uncharacterized protein LOC111710591 [Eurytemora carolleeae]|eukprot:XP_023340470.1 uncharacterized protein LOC111710591 [Eurytemora affinis]
MPLKQDRLIPFLCLCFISYSCWHCLLADLGMASITSKYLVKQTMIGQNTFQYKFEITVREFWEGIQYNDKLLDIFLDTLKSSQFKSFFFETPSVTSNLLENKFEYVLVSVPQLSGVPEDKTAFSEHFTDSDSAVSFPNLGKDATLVCPVPAVQKPVYAHLALFVNNAPDAQVKDFWRVAGRVVLETITSKKGSPVWISTSGLGIYWLHLRIDSVAKYYQFQPYKTEVY